jgi:hypothetical protein
VSLCARKVTTLCTDDGGTQISSDAVGSNRTRRRHIRGLRRVLVWCWRGCNFGLVVVAVGIDGLVGRSGGLPETRLQLGDSLEVGSLGSCWCWYRWWWRCRQCGLERSAHQLLFECLQIRVLPFGFLCQLGDLLLVLGALNFEIRSFFARSLVFFGGSVKSTSSTSASKSSSTRCRSWHGLRVPS